MDFISERTALNILSETIVKCGVSLFNAIKYIYSLAAEDFYHISIKDCLKVVLNNVADTDCLQALSLRITGDRCGEMNNEAYNRVLHMMVYSFAVRIPTLRQVKNGNDEMSEDQMHALYDMVISKGAANYEDTIRETYLEMRYLVKKNKPIPPYTADWYKNYVRGEVPELAAITNKNMFLFGFVDILFAMFYSCMEEELHNIILEQCVKK